MSLSVSDLDRQIEVLKRCELIKESEVKALCAKAREILVEESNVQRVDSPVTVNTLVLFGRFFEVSILLMRIVIYLLYCINLTKLSCETL
jgi:hypothetical protein